MYKLKSMFQNIFKKNINEQSEKLEPDMVVKEMEFKDNTKYTIGIVDNNKQNTIECYILEKTSIGYTKIFCDESWKSLKPNYNDIAITAICNYERELENKKRLLEWKNSII